MMMRISRSELEKVLGVLLKKTGPVKLSMEEIEDAPDVEFRQLFETDEIEMRVSTYGKTVS